jgi:leucyl/phenylalanyl-tRNA---protein transferase
MLSWCEWCRRLGFFRPSRTGRLVDTRPEDPLALTLLGPGDPFPPPERASREGLLAVGGDLSPSRLLQAYRLGIFPWYEAGGPVLWWSPDPRMVLDPAALRVARSLRAVIRKRTYSTTFDTAFRRVVNECAVAPRREGPGSWITPEVEVGYLALHDLGYAHSVETWQAGELVGGLYGVLLGRCFFGESMFATSSDASKVALVSLAAELVRRGVTVIDCQVTSGHLASLGAEEMPRAEFLRRLEEGLRLPEIRGSWATS